MREQQIHAARLRGHVVLHHARIALLGIPQQPLEIGDVAVDRGAEVSVALVAPADLVERRLAVEAVEMAPKHPALAGAEALPHLGGGAVVDSARDLVETKACCGAVRNK